MSKPVQLPFIICLILTIFVGIGILLGLLHTSALIIAFSLLPVVVYEVFRTEGVSTKASSFILLVVLVLEIILIIFKINFDLSKFFGKSGTYIASYNIPLGDLKIVGPALMAICSLILFKRTNGPYTKWLAVLIFITCFVLIYSIDPVNFNGLLKKILPAVIR